MQPLELKRIKQLYQQGANVMRLVRGSAEGNSIGGILASYDLQAGSYVRSMEQPEHAQFVARYAAALAEIFDRYSPGSVMEAGVGEATTLANVLRHMRRPPVHALGFDISWSRIAVARRYASAKEISPLLFLADLAGIPVESGAVDVVYTSHSIEPNRGQEKEILAELYRVARRFLVLLEPSNELGGDATRRHIEEHQYCLDLRRHADELGFNVLEHRLFDHAASPSNQTALMVIAKQTEGEVYRGTFLACPGCRARLLFHKGNYFCAECLMAYPVLDGVPCLRASHGIVATHYLEEA